jgi:hypothetical protein
MTCTVIVKDGTSPQIGAKLKRLVSAVLDLPKSWIVERNAGASAL